MARENFSIGALYNITKNQHNPIKTGGRDSFLSPQNPKKYRFCRGRRGVCITDAQFKTLVKFVVFRPAGPTVVNLTLTLT